MRENSALARLVLLLQGDPTASMDGELLDQILSNTVDGVAKSIEAESFRRSAKSGSATPAGRLLEGD